ncbi:MAG: hypothetical protein M1557_07210 [Actinobacteria bacterium]|nr:hypothetical protein [Actinomycetota bacterium]
MATSTDGNGVDSFEQDQPRRSRRHSGPVQYRGPDRRTRGHLALPDRHQHRLAIARMMIVVFVVILVAGVAQVLVDSFAGSTTLSDLDAIDDVTSTAMLLLATIAAMSSLLGRRLMGHINYAFVGFGLLFVFVLAPMLLRVPYVIGNLDPVWILAAYVSSISAAIVGLTLLIMAPFWPRIDTALSTLRLGLWSVTLAALVSLGLSALPVHWLLVISPVATLVTRPEITSVPSLVVGLDAVRWLGLVVIFAWRSRDLANAVPATWMAGGLLLAGIASVARIATPLEPGAVVALDILGLGASALLVAAAAVGLDRAIDTYWDALRDAEIARRSRQLADEAHHEAWGRYTHDLRSSITAISLYLNWSLSASSHDGALQSRVHQNATQEFADLVREEVQRIVMLSQHTPDQVTFDLRELVQRWCDQRLSGRGYVVDVPVGQQAFGSEELLREVMDLLLTFGTTLGDVGGDGEIIIGTTDSGEQIIVAIWFEMAKMADPADNGAKQMHVSQGSEVVIVASVTFQACRQVLRAQGGDLRVLADRPGFAVVLPSCEDSLTAVPSETS